MPGAIEDASESGVIRVVVRIRWASFHALSREIAGEGSGIGAIGRQALMHAFPAVYLSIVIRVKRAYLYTSHRGVIREGDVGSRTQSYALPGGVVAVGFLGHWANLNA